MVGRHGRQRMTKAEAGAAARRPHRFVNLVELHGEKNPRFEKLLTDSQTILGRDIPVEELESRETLMTYFDGMKEGEYGRDKFAYWVPVRELDGKAGGMFSYDVLAPGRGNFGVMFDGYFAIRRGARGQGLGKKLFSVGVADAVMHARENGYDIKYVFGEVDLPKTPAQIRHAKALGAIRHGVVPVVMQPDGSYKVIYYAQPGLEQGAAEVPMMPVFSKVEAWAGQSGIDSVKPADILPKADVVRVINRVLDSYEEAPYANPEQIGQIRENVKESVRGSAFLKMVPISETIGMAQDGVKK